MNKIEVKVLNPEAIPQAEKMMVCAARLTQRGHSIKSMADFLELYEKHYTSKTVCGMTMLPHPTIQKFAAINVVVVGASRRFLAQVTRHQNEVKFMSASLQYSDYSGEAAFAVPYEVLERGEEEAFVTSCQTSMDSYAGAIELGLNNDAAGYIAPQALRNVLIISATPYQWKHMISQRVCRALPLFHGLPSGPGKAFRFLCGRLHAGRKAAQPPAGIPVGFRQIISLLFLIPFRQTVPDILYAFMHHPYLR